MRRKFPLLFITALALIASILAVSCNKIAEALFTPADDKKVGALLETEIAKHPAQFPLLDRTTYQNAYTYINAMRDSILASGKLSHATDFDWKIYIVQNDTIQTAISTPGGYIYVYTGLIKYADNASTLAGLLGHVMAHADQRHLTNQLIEKYGAQNIINAAAGQDSTLLASIADSIATVAFSQANEQDADNHSVIYLCPTQYRADGLVDFFQKVNNVGGPASQTFFILHPNPNNRIGNIQTQKTTLGCNHTPTNQVEVTDYATFKASLP